jgi:hypothetical protein
MDARVKPEHDEWGAMLGLDPSMTNGARCSGLTRAWRHAPGARTSPHGGAPMVEANIIPL